jgi:hypothetical protein
MGCDHSLSKYSSIICCNGETKHNHKSNIDQHEFENKQPHITNNCQPFTRSELSENLNLKVSFHGTFKKEVEDKDARSKNTNDPNRTNCSINSYIYIPQENLISIKEIEKPRSLKRTGKAFIQLMKEFNFTYRLFRKCNKNFREEAEYVLDCENSLNSQNSLNISVQSNNTINSKNRNNFPFEIKSSILKENKLKSLAKDYFEKIKNLFYIPLISYVGEVKNFFIIKQENENLNKFVMMEYIVELPFSETVTSCFFNWLDNLENNLNSVNYIENLNPNLTYSKNHLNPVINLFKIVDLLKVIKVKFIFNTESIFNLKNEKVYFGISLCHLEHIGNFEDLLNILKKFESADMRNFFNSFDVFCKSIEKIVFIKELKFFFSYSNKFSLSMDYFEIRFSRLENCSDIFEFLGLLCQNVENFPEFDLKPNFIKLTNLIKDSNEFSIVFSTPSNDNSEFLKFVITKIKFYKNLINKNKKTEIFFFNSVKNLKIINEVVKIDNDSSGKYEISYLYEI